MQKQEITDLKQAYDYLNNKLNELNRAIKKILPHNIICLLDNNLRRIMYSQAMVINSSRIEQEIGFYDKSLQISLVNGNIIDIKSNGNGIYHSCNSNPESKVKGSQRSLTLANIKNLLTKEFGIKIYTNIQEIYVGRKNGNPTKY